MKLVSVLRGTLAFLLFPFLASSQAVPRQGTRDPLAVYPHDRIASAISDNVTVPLTGDVNPKARPEYDAGPVAADFKMSAMVLGLLRAADQQTALDVLTAAQQDPRSPLYRRWLTPAEFGAHFGLSQNDLTKIAVWLKGEGFTVDDIPAARSTVTFSGTAGEVEKAFHTPIHYYRVDGKLDYANSEHPRIPQALGGLIYGIRGLNDFRLRPLDTAKTGALGKG